MLQLRVETYKSQESLKWIILKPEHHFKCPSKKALSFQAHSPANDHLQIVQLSQVNEPLGSDLKGWRCWLMLFHRPWSPELEFKFLDRAFKTIHAALWLPLVIFLPHLTCTPPLICSTRSSGREKPKTPCITRHPPPKQCWGGTEHQVLHDSRADGKLTTSQRTSLNWKSSNSLEITNLLAQRLHGPQPAQVIYGY